MSPSDKQALKEALIDALCAELDTLERAHQATREAATHEEAKPENDKDTRALEQSYLARGQAMRVEELRNGLAEVRAMQLRTFGERSTVAVSALVTLLDEDDEERSVFLAPAGGGTVLRSGVQVVTPRSPLGRALLGKRVGEACEVALGGRERVLELRHME